MGKSGYLPDISSTFSFWRQYAVNCLSQKDYQGAEAGLHNVNACLTEEYLIELNSVKYNEETQESFLYVCGHCKEKTPQTEIRVFELLLPRMESYITEKKHMKVWECSHCLKDMPLEYTDMVHKKRSSPIYQKYMYELQKQPLGLMVKHDYMPKFRIWFYKFLVLLQHQMAIYRIEYISQNEGEDMQDSGHVMKEIN